MKDNQIPVDHMYKRPLQITLVTQVIMVLFSGFVMDGGDISKMTLVAMVAFWASVLIIIIRNPSHAKKFDCNYIKYGFILVWLVTLLLRTGIWKWRGVI